MNIEYVKLVANLTVIEYSIVEKVGISSAG